MAIAVPDPRQAMGGAGTAPDHFRPIARLLSGLWSIRSVRKVAVSADAGQVDLWVLMGDETTEDEARVFQVGREYRNAVGPAPFDMHVFPIREIDESLLPPAETLFER